MSVHKNEKGFGLAELMVGMVISSILALTAGMMLYSIFLSWHRNKNAIESQRDGTIALYMMSRAIRPATNSSVAASGSTLTIGNKSFYLNASSLWHDPDTGSPGDEIEIIRNNVSNLSFVKDSTMHSVAINITLLDGLVLDSVIGYRT